MDRPATEDELGPHQEIASAIASLIEDEPGGKAVALVGSWGSGKSTVANLLADELSVSDKVDAFTFVFDAWVHEGDPLRLAFLKTFASQLHRKWGGPDWSHKLDRLERRTEETVSEAATEIDRTSALVLVSLALLPLGYLLFAEALNQQAALRWWGFWVGLALLTPFFWIIVNALVRVLRGETTHVPALLARQLPETVTISTVRTPDPTSLEFQDTFSRMVQHGLPDSFPERRLILVIDNLDRVDRSAALRAWGTMRSFFEMTTQSDRERARWREQLWLLVPFDPGGVSRLWSEKGEGETSEASNSPSVEPLVTAFLDKTFQVTFHVPPPVVSDWRSFLISRLREALPRHDEEETLHTLYRLVHRRVSTTDGWLPTPRNLKRFVNRLSAIHRQWCDAGISLGVQARYALHGEQLTISREGFLIVNGKEEKDPKTARQLAAIQFNVPPEKAFQVILSPPIERALADADVEALESLASTPGFFEVSEHVLDSYMELGAPEVGRAALAIAGLREGEETAIRRLWRRLEVVARNIQTLQNMNKASGEGLALVVQRAPEDRRRDLGISLLNLAKSALNEFSADEEGTSDEMLASYTGGLVQLLSGLQQALASEKVFQDFELEGSPSVVAEILALIASEDEGTRWCGRLAPSDSGDAEGFATLIREGKFDGRHARALELIAEAKPDRTYQPVVEAALEFFRNSSTPADSGRPVISALVGLWRSGADIEGIERSDLKGALLHHFQEAVNRNEWSWAGLCATAVLLTDPAVAQFDGILGHSNNGANFLRQLNSNPSQRTELVTEIAKVAQELKTVNQLLGQTLSDSASRELGAAILGRTVEGQGADHGLSSDLLFDHFPFLSSRLNEEGLRILMEGMLASGEIARHLERTGLQISEALAYTSLVGVEGWKELCPSLRSGLRAVSEEDWASDLSGDRSLLALAQALVAAGCQVRLATQLRIALLELIEHSLTGSQVDLPAASELSAVMVPQSIRALFRAVVDRLSQADVGEAEQVIEAFGEEIIRSGLVKDERLESLVTRFGPAAIGRSNPVELAWLARILSVAERITPRAEGVLSASAHAKLNDPSLPDSIRTEVQEILEHLESAD